MKIIDNKLKYSKVIIFDHKSYVKNYDVSIKLCPENGDFVKKNCPGTGILNGNFKLKNGAARYTHIQIKAISPIVLIVTTNTLPMTSVKLLILGG